MTYKLNLGAGKDTKPGKDGWINQDIFQYGEIDDVFDFNEYPFR